MKHFLFTCLLAVCVLGCKESPCLPSINREKARIIMDDVSRRNLAYEPLTEHDDTMMQHVVAYYKEHGTSNDVMEAYYLLGSVYRDLHEAPKAMEAFLNGINAADTIDRNCRYDILTRLYGQESDILYRQSLHRQSAEVEKKVYKYAVLAKDTLFMVAAQWKKLNEYFASSDYQTVARECWDILEESKQMGLFSYGASNLCICILANMELGQVEDAAELLSIYEQHSGCVDLRTHECSSAKHSNTGGTFPLYYYAKGRVLAATYQLDSAEYFYRKELEAQDWDNRQAAYRGLRMVFEQKGLTDSICKYASLQCNAVDSSYQGMLSQSLQNLHELYNYNRLQTENIQKELLLQESRRKALYTWCALAFIVACSLFLIFYLRSWYKQRITNAELKLERANAELEERENNLAALYEELAKVNDEKGKQRLAMEIEEAERETEKQRKIVMNNQEKLDELRLRARTKSKTLRQQHCQTSLFQMLLLKAKRNVVATDQDIELIKKTLLEKDADLLYRFFKLLPNYSDTELQVFLMLRLGMTKTETALLTAHSQAAIINICTRLFLKANGRKSSTSAEAYDWLLKL